MLRRSKLLILVLLGSFLLGGCGQNKLVKEAGDQAKLALADGEYERALKSFELAEKEGGRGQELKEIMDLIRAYLKAQDLEGAGEFKEALELLSPLEELAENYPIKADFKDLSQRLIDQAQDQEEVQEEMAKYSELEKVIIPYLDRINGNRDSIVAKYGPPSDQGYLHGGLYYFYENNGDGFSTIFDESRENLPVNCYVVSGTLGLGPKEEIKSRLGQALDGGWYDDIEGEGFEGEYLHYAAFGMNVYFFDLNTPEPYVYIWNK